MAVLDVERAERISLEARQIRFGRTLLTLFAAFFYALGWLLGAIWLALVWSVTAMKVGIQDGSGRPRGTP